VDKDSLMRKELGTSLIILRECGLEETREGGGGGKGAHMLSVLGGCPPKNPVDVGNF